MFSRLFTQKKTETYNDKIARLKEVLEEADVVLVGAGAGLSTSAGFVYDGERFQKYFRDFKEKYGFQGYVLRRLLSLRYTGRTLGVLEPLYLDQPLCRRPETGI